MRSSRSDGRERGQERRGLGLGAGVHAQPAGEARPLLTSRTSTPRSSSACHTSAGRLERAEQQEVRLGRHDPQAEGLDLATMRSRWAVTAATVDSSSSAWLRRTRAPPA
jgi:hypothetical protein